MREEHRTPHPTQQVPRVDRPLNLLENLLEAGHVRIGDPATLPVAVDDGLVGARLADLLFVTVEGACFPVNELREVVEADRYLVGLGLG